uniref:Uncharacterized protein n=1 Tax=Hyaloperonospora arabidopsidis (strain Emoy2) TaxID=559515 RepID=M4B9D0_HYAAE
MRIVHTRVGPKASQLNLVERTHQALHRHGGKNDVPVWWAHDSTSSARNIARCALSLRPLIYPWLMTPKPGHTENEIISRVQIQDKTKFDGVKVYKLIT